METFQKIAKVEYNMTKVKERSEDLADLISGMLKKNASDRISAKEAL